MQIMKGWIDRFVPEDTKHQCRKHAGCHRRDGHDGECRTLGAAFAANAIEIARGWAQRMKGARHER